MIGRFAALMARDGSFGKNVALLAGGAAVGQLAALAVSPILSRLYSPADFGVLAVFSGLLTYLTALSALTYEKAILAANDDAEGYALLGLAWRVVIVTSLFIGVVLLAGSGPILSLFRIPEFKPWAWLVPLGMFLAGSNLCLTVWATRRQVFVPLAQSKLAQGVWRAVVQVGAGFTGSGAMGLVAGDTVGRIAGTATVWKNAPAPESDRSFDALQLAAKYRNFPLYGVGSVLLHQAGIALPPLALAALYSKEAAGFFNLGLLVAWFPLAMVAQSVGSVFAGRLSASLGDSERNSLSLFDATAKRLAAIGFLPVAFVAVAGPDLFAFVFGERWQESGVYMQSLALTIFVQFVSGPLYPSLNILQRQREVLVADAVGFVMIVGGMVLAKNLGFGPRIAVLAFAVGSMVLYSTLFFLARRAVAGRV